MKMKNKKETDKRKREEHRERLRKQRRKEPNLDRREATKETKPYILIVCEGKNTEPDYFRHFRVSSVRIKAIGEGFNTVSLVERAEKLSGRDEYDEVWCVFDKDGFTDEDFNMAIALAEEKGYRVGYSNQAFEYWLLLHFNDHQGGGMSRGDYKRKLNEALKPFGVKYDNDSKHLQKELLELLDGVDERTGQKRVDQAIARARRACISHKGKTAAKSESSTTVYKLVESLISYK